MKNKTLIAIITILILLVGLSFLYDLPKKQKLTDCSKPLDVIFLKSSEISQSSGILNSGLNRVVVIPERNQINAKTELLECNPDLTQYLNLNIFDW